MTGPERYAEVALGVAAGKLFLYRIPPSLQDKISLGRKVSVPLGGRLSIGYIVGLPQETPSIPLRDIEEVLEDRPFLDAHLLEFTKRVAEDYLAPWGEVIKAALPPISRSVGRWVFRLSSDQAAPPSSSSPLERKIWEALNLASPSPLSLNQLQRRLGIKDLSPALMRMQGKGWLLRQMVPVRARRASREELPPALMSEQEGNPPGGEEEAMPAELLPLQSSIEEPAFSVFLLLGGFRRQRTRRYRRVLDLVLRCQKGALLLVPEIELASSWMEELASLYGSRIASLHSGLSVKDREREWSRVQEGKASIVIGTRSAVFIPHPRLGLILIDDEHDPSFKQEDVPRYHAREVALARAKLLGIPLILASVTPSLESFYKAEQGEYRLLTVTDQEKKDSTQVSLVDMRMEPRESGRVPLISATLRRAIEERVAASQRVVLLINRRGYFGHLLCRECGCCLQCPQCSVPLVLHRAERKLICHQCGRGQSPPDRCPYCRGVIMSYFSPGTQQLEEEVRRLYPKARVARLDRDALPGKARPRARTDRLTAEGIDIVVGTQMVLKGPDLQCASLVGVLFADSLLSLPDFRAGERLFCLLMETIQDGASAPVCRPSGSPVREVIIQTHNPGHYVLQALKAQDYLLFYQREIESRRALSLPPFFQLAHLEISAKTEERARRAALALASLLRAHAPSSQLLDGPAPSPLSRLRGRYRWRLLAKGERGPFTARLGQALERFHGSPARSGTTIRVDIDPLRLY